MKKLTGRGPSAATQRFGHLDRARCSTTAVRSLPLQTSVVTISFWLNNAEARKTRSAQPGCCLLFVSRSFSQIRYSGAPASLSNATISILRSPRFPRLRVTKPKSSQTEEVRCLPGGAQPACRKRGIHWRAQHKKKGASGALFKELQLLALIRESVVLGITSSVRVLAFLVLLLSFAIDTELRNWTSHEASH